MANLLDFLNPNANRNNQNTGLFDSNTLTDTGANNALDFTSNTNPSPLSGNSFGVPGNFTGGSGFEFPTQGGGGQEGLFNSLDFGKLGQGVGIGSDIIGALLGIKQFGLAQKGLKHGIALDKANLANSTALAQQQLNDRANRRAIERPNLFKNQEVAQLRQTL